MGGERRRRSVSHRRESVLVMARRFRWVATVVVVAAAMLWSSTPAQRAAAVHDHTWEPWATHVVTVAYNATTTVTWTHAATGASLTRSCTLTQGYHDQSRACVSGPLPGSPFTSIPGHTVTSHSIAWHDPRTFDLAVCTPTGVLMYQGHQYPSGLPCASPPPTTTSTTTTSTTTISDPDPDPTTTTLPSSCSTGHSHTGDGRNCHGHTFVPTTCGAAYRTINGNGHDQHIVRSVPPCTIQPDPPIQPDPSSCSTGRHSHTGDGRNCHSHTFVPTTCGASYQVINGDGHDTRIVRSVPPCRGTTPTTTTVAVDCAEQIEADAAGLGGCK